MVRRLATTVLSLGAFSLAAASAKASPSAKLTYVRGAGAESCPPERELRDAVAARIGYDPFFPVAQKTVVAQIMRAPGGYRGRVQIVGDDGTLRGERELAVKGDDCHELTAAMALAVSVALDDLDEPEPDGSADVSSAPEPREEPHEEPVSGAATEPRPLPAEAPKEEAAPAPASRAHLALGLGPTVAFGTAPNPALGGALSAALRLGLPMVRLDVRGDLPTSKAIGGGGTVETSGFVALATACLASKVFFGCAGGGGGLLRSRTSGLSRPGTDGAPFGVLAARTGANVSLGSSLFLEPAVDVGLNLARHVVVVDARPVHRLSAVWASLGIALGVKIF